MLQPLDDQTDDDAIGNEQSGVHVALGFCPKLGAGGHGRAEHIACRYPGLPGQYGDSARLGALARAGGAEQYNRAAHRLDGSGVGDKSSAAYGLFCSHHRWP